LRARGSIGQLAWQAFAAEAQWRATLGVFDDERSYRAEKLQGL
jgi:hypothetical protein